MDIKQHSEFITVTCLEWKMVLEDDANKDIIIESLRFLAKEERAIIYGFVIMDNHFHMIWQMVGDHLRENVQRDFLKFAGQQILKRLRNINSNLLPTLLVQAMDRKYQVWERNSLGIALWSSDVFIQKLNYIHTNPVRAGLCKNSDEYKYSSARFYETGEKKEWNFLTHYRGE